MRHAVVLDIGSSKVVGVCGSISARNDLVIHGVAIKEYSGYRFGEFLEKKAAADAILDTIQKLEEETKQRIRQVSLVVPPSFSKLQLKNVSLELSSEPRRITHTDIDMLINESLEDEPLKDYVLMHSTPVSFRLDHVEQSGVPIGVSGCVLEAAVSHMYVKRDFLRFMQDALDGLDIRVGMCVAAALTEPLFVIPPQDRVRPAVLLDIGYTHTDVIVMENAAVTANCVLEVGGMHLASDLCYGLNIPISAAEQLKRRYVFSLDYQDSEETIRTSSGACRIAHADVQYIIEARAQELTSMIAEQLQRMKVALTSRTAVYLVGAGIAQMRGGIEFVEQNLGVRIKRDMPWMPRLNTPGYMSTLGALEFILDAGGEDDDYTFQPQTESGGVMQKIRSFFNM